MPKHSKGPWRRKGKYVVRAKPDPGSHRKPTDEQIVVVVRANQKYRTGKYDEENAALIADAPAMWLALELVRRELAVLDTDDGTFLFRGEKFPLKPTWTELIDSIGWAHCYTDLGDT